MGETNTSGSQSAAIGNLDVAIGSDSRRKDAVISAGDAPAVDDLDVAIGLAGLSKQAVVSGGDDSVVDDRDVAAIDNADRAVDASEDANTVRIGTHRRDVAAVHDAERAAVVARI